MDQLMWVTSEPPALSLRRSLPMLWNATLGVFWERLAL